MSIMWLWLSIAVVKLSGSRLVEAFDGGRALPLRLAGLGLMSGGSRLARRSFGVAELADLLQVKAVLLRERAVVVLEPR